MKFLFLCLAIAGGILTAGTLEGTLVNSDGHPIHDATVAVIELRRSVTVDKEGRFEFGSVPAGTYTLIATSDEFGSKLFRAEIADGEKKQLRLEIDITIHEELTVTATPTQKSISDVAQAVGVLNKEDLTEKLETTLGETLAGEPGVSSTYGGPGASRPVVRGLSGDRIAVLEGGMASGDVSSVSGDHAVAIDPMTAERIEILRGPASLRYGSSAVGGAINVIDNRIPELLGDEKLTGDVELRGGTVSNERGIGVNLNGSSGNLAWHVDFAGKDADDVEIPGVAAIEEDDHDDDHDDDHHDDDDDDHKRDEDDDDHDDDHDEEQVEGLLENSSIENRKGAVGFSYITDRGYVGVAVSAFDSLYGVPGHSHHHHEDDHDDDHHDDDHDDDDDHKRDEDDDDHDDDHGEEEEEDVRIDMKQRRIDLRGERRLESELFESINFRLGRSDYEHTELEGDEVGTVFTNEQIDFRAELLHGDLGVFSSGSFGFHYSDRDFSAEGEEAFVPPNQTEKMAAFVYEEYDREDWSLVWGARYERQTNEADTEDGMFDRDFNSLSTSLGYVFRGNEDYGFSANLSRTERAPNAEELFSNGPHLASASFEVGNLDLDKETSLGLDVSLRKKKGIVTGEINLFSNRFDDFIYQRVTGEEIDELIELVFTQEDATFRGGEIHADIALLQRESDHLNLELTYDTVRAELSDSGYLPRITPDRLTVGLSYQRTHLHLSADVRRTMDQDRVAEQETETEGYTFFNASIGYHFIAGKTVHKLLLRGTNLGDEEARQHTSFLKDRTMLPGRNLALTWRLSF